MIIGITGGTGCGKTTLLDVICQQGGLVLDCDVIYHQLLETNEAMLREIEDRFPGTVENGKLQRKKLGSIVFADKDALSDLNRITGRHVYDEVLRRLNTKNDLIAIDAIGLFGGLHKLCDVTVAVTAPEEARVARLLLRDGITEEYARSRIAAQKPQAEFSRLCDHTLHNDGTKEAFREKCLAFLAGLGIMKA